MEPHPRMDGLSMCARSPPCPSIWGAGNKTGGVSLAGRAVVRYEASIGVLPQRWDCRSVEQPLHLDVAGVWEDGIKRTGHRSLLAHRLGKDASPCGFVPPGTAVSLLFSRYSDLLDDSSFREKMCIFGVANRGHLG